MVDHVGLQVAFKDSFAAAIDRERVGVMDGGGGVDTSTLSAPEGRKVKLVTVTSRASRTFGARVPVEHQIEPRVRSLAVEAADFLKRESGSSASVRAFASAAHLEFDEGALAKGEQPRGEKETDAEWAARPRENVIRLTVRYALAQVEVVERRGKDALA